MLSSAETQLQRYHDLVQALASLARSTHGVEAVMRMVHEQARALFPAFVTMLALREPDGDWMCELFAHEHRYTQHLPFEPGGMIEEVLDGKSLSIPDISAYLETDPIRRQRMQAAQASFLNQNLQEGQELPLPPAVSMLFVPLGVQGERRGVLSIQSYVADAFDDSDLQLLNLLAQHVAIALENAVLREQLEQLVRTDRLTGLPNRRAFYDDVPLAVETARQTGQDLSLVMLDVHKFKRINDTFGHVVGDAVLVTLGTALMQVIPPPGAVFRLSGDEFVLLVWEPENRLSELAGRITQALHEAAWPPGVGPVCLQGGAAQSLLDVELDEWLSLADARMYRAKQQRAASCQTECCVDFGDPVFH